jgi:hypothetical protein
MASYIYNPIPPRAWSRVQNSCTYNTTPITNPIINSLLIKGNILQYKGNSARLTKSQKYAQLAKCLGPSRTKVFATQSQTYTNPNTDGLLRVNSITLPNPLNVPNPNNCPINSLQDGGNLVGGTYANQCTGEIIKVSPSVPQFFPSSCSDVPGTPIELYWNPRITSWIPKQRYIMNNSNSIGPIIPISATTPAPPILTILTTNPTSNTVELSWAVNICKTLPITSFNIYVNNTLFQKILNTGLYTITLQISTPSINKIYITSLSGTIESTSSNIVTFDNS